MSIKQKAEEYIANLDCIKALESGGHGYLSLENIKGIIKAAFGWGAVNQCSLLKAWVEQFADCSLCGAMWPTCTCGRTRYRIDVDKLFEFLEGEK